MGTGTLWYSNGLASAAADAAHRIEEWFRRGYVMFSDVQTKSTHLRRVEQGSVCAPPSKRH